jgi:AraC-like DNA-binding protein
VRAAIVFPMALWGTLWLTRLDGEKLTFQPLKAIAIESPKLDPRDKNLHLQLLNEMQQQQAYRESGLTIRVLAARLKVPEHRLRALINQGMGYRNFSGFVNDYRIEAIKQAMQKPENARTPILTLALNEGFNSLAPFNRAFRAITGQTPTEYRDNLYRKANQN